MCVVPGQNMWKIVDRDDDTNQNLSALIPVDIDLLTVDLLYFSLLSQSHFTTKAQT